MKIITNNHWRSFKYYHDLSDRRRQEVNTDYDWMTQEEREYADWITYRDRVYCGQDFMRLSGNHPFPAVWHGYLSDSFFSGVLIKLSDCGDAYQIATYY